MYKIFSGSSLVLYSLKTKKIIKSISKGIKGSCYCGIISSRNGRLGACGSDDGNVFVYDLDRNALLRKFKVNLNCVESHLQSNYITIINYNFSRELTLLEFGNVMYLRMGTEGNMCVLSPFLTEVGTLAWIEKV